MEFVGKRLAGHGLRLHYQFNCAAPSDRKPGWNGNADTAMHRDATPGWRVEPGHEQECAKAF